MLGGDAGVDCESVDLELLRLFGIYLTDTKIGHLLTILHIPHLPRTNHFLFILHGYHLNGLLSLQSHIFLLYYLHRDPKWLVFLDMDKARGDDQLPNNSLILEDLLDYLFLLIFRVRVFGL